MSKEGFITRRDFIRGTAGAALATAFGAGAAPEARAEKTAKVVLIRDAKALNEKGEIQAENIQKMLDEAVKALLEEKEVAQAWRKLVRASDIVGIKSNSWGRLPTPPELEEAIKRRVLEAGVPEENVGIDDRGVLRNPIFKKATALINVRPLRTHHWSGVGTCLKNYIMFVPDPSKLPRRGLLVPGKDMDLSDGEGQDPPEHPQRSDSPVLRARGELL